MDAELKAYLEEKFGALLRQIAGVGSRLRHDPASNAQSGARPDPSERVVDSSLERLERRIDDLERRMTGLQAHHPRNPPRAGGPSGAGLVRMPERPLDVKAFLAAERPRDPGGRTLESILEERAEGG